MVEGCPARKAPAIPTVSGTIMNLFFSSEVPPGIRFLMGVALIVGSLYLMYRRRRKS